MRGVLIAAPSSGSGKTVAVMGLLAVLKQKGVGLAAFKCGPDYIDPLFHRKVLEVESCNLDSFFLPADQVRALAERTLAETAGPEGFGVVEGVMGYFDGLGGVSARGSSREMAQILELPAILVVDGRGASLSLAALIQGFLNYTPSDGTGRGNRIAGVIFNRVGGGMYDMLKKTVEAELPVKCLGYIPKMDWLNIESRHLGLVLPDEIADLKGVVKRLGEELERTLDWEGILALGAGEGEDDEGAGSGSEKAAEPAEAVNFRKNPLNDASPRGSGTARPSFRLAVAMDEAFCFYYRENLRALEAAGAQLCYFSPIHDRKLPEQAAGLLLGGGYPELHAGELAANQEMRERIRSAAEFGMPILAECGGYLYLLDELEGDDGAVYPMAGVFEGTGLRENKLRQFGYITVSSGQDGLYLKHGEMIRAHEFHYWHCARDGELAVMRAVKPTGRRSWPAMREKKRVLAGFPHLYYPSCPEFVRRFGEQCRQYYNEKNGKLVEKNADIAERD
ncbi:cobyrinate a,c-diamide synthase [Enterocloster lavalensis]|uniref:cobyrinate a,c-diamide synthase n=1 Tax=Enterocloster lavalensis TaxID=460384 RepID=UPI0023F2DC61|nr:cobyrinate a,c-diamide synthase [Enterocloster lavalensis]